MSRNRKNDYFCTFKSCKEEFWHRSGYEKNGYRYYRLVLELNKDYRGIKDALEDVRRYLGPLAGSISHFNFFSDQQKAFIKNESRVERLEAKKEGLGILASNFSHNSKGWEVELLCLNEPFAENWSVKLDFR